MTTQVGQEARALQILQDDAEKINRLIEVQMEHLSLPKCPLYEEVLDTQMFGFSRQIHFAVRVGLITHEQGQQLLGDLERRLADLCSSLPPGRI